ncbi:MAG: N-acetylmuramoyl-L-alanine amidase [Myxococcota bacterium]
MRRFLVLFSVGFALGTVVAGAVGAGYIGWRLHQRSQRPVWGEVVRPVAGPRPVPAGPTGPLAGTVVYLSAGHGILLHRRHHDGDPISWGTQRGTTNGMIEDYWTANFVADWLAPAIEAAGGTVIALRERDKNPEAYVLDDTDPGFSSFGLTEVVADPLAVGGHALRLAPGGSAAWRFVVPKDGHFYLYGQWSAAEDQDTQAILTVQAGEEVTELVVDQTDHGGHWWPLGDRCLREGTTVVVTLTGSGTEPLSADAIRIGGGTYRILLPWNNVVKEKPVWEVAFPHQLERLGAPEWIETFECGNPVSDMRLRPHWASWAAPVGEDALYLSIHTNAVPRGRAKGLTSFYGFESSPPTEAHPESVRLAHTLDRAVWTAVHAHDKGYEDRGTKPGDYSEISPVHNMLPSALLEMGFHTDADDARRMNTPQFKRDAAQGIVDGLVEWRAGRTPGAGPIRTEASRQRGAPWDVWE